VQVLPRGPIWNVNRTSEPGLGANECAPLGKFWETDLQDLGSPLHGIPVFADGHPARVAQREQADL
jgi:hypothetical protein